MYDRNTRIVAGIACILLFMVAIWTIGRSSVENTGNGMSGTAGSKCWLGVEVLPVNRRAVKSFGLPYRRGLLVRKVFAGSPAMKGGLKEGDVIMRIGSNRILGHARIGKFTGRMKPGQKVRIIVGNAKGKRTLYVKAEPKPRHLFDPSVQNIAYQNYTPPVNRPYPYFYFGEESEEEEE